MKPADLSHSLVTNNTIGDHINTPIHASNFLHADNIAIRYGEQTVCENIDIEMPRESITALIGASGCGKSSLLNGLSGMWKHIEHCQLEGNIYYPGQETPTQAPALGKLGVIFQAPSPFPFSIYKNFSLALKEHGVRNKHDIHDIMQQYLQLVGLWDEVKDKLASAAVSLSGGQQQRLCIARALALQPQALFLDEPCSALDPLSSEIIEGVLQQLKLSTPIFLITHNLSQAKRLGDHIVFMANENGRGRIIESGHNSEVFERPAKEQTRRFIASFFR